MKTKFMCVFTQHSWHCCSEWTHRSGTTAARSRTDLSV